MTERPKVSFVTVAYRTPDLIRVLLSGVRDANFGFSYEYFVVNNAPGDGLKEIVEAEFPWVRYIDAPGNVGFGAGNNLAFAQAQGEYLMASNPDLAYFAGEMEKLVAYADAHPEAGILAPRLNNPNGTLQRNFHRFPSLLTPVYRRTFLGRTRWGRCALDAFHMREVEVPAEPIDVDGSYGAALLLRRGMLDEVGAFDERYFMYFEDVDLCRRAWAGGWKVRYVPHAALVHYHQRESDVRFPWQILKSRTVRAHIASAVKYFWKYRNVPSPRLR